MKRCPTCNQTFDEDWLSFCTNDGTSLVDAEVESQRKNEQSPAIETPYVAEPTWQLSQPAQLPQPITPAWQPPPPPTIAQPPSNGLATAAMITGILSVTCLGPIPAIVAIVLGTIALSQIKKSPETMGGKQSAVIGIITGSVTIVIYTGLIIVYIIAIVASVNSR